MASKYRSARHISREDTVLITRYISQYKLSAILVPNQIGRQHRRSNILLAHCFCKHWNSISFSYYYLFPSVSHHEKGWKGNEKGFSIERTTPQYHHNKVNNVSIITQSLSDQMCQVFPSLTQKMALIVDMLIILDEINEKLITRISISICNYWFCLWTILKLLSKYLHEPS